MKKLMTFFVLITFSGQITAQNAVWYFGNQGGVTFTNCSPLPSSGTISINSIAGSTIVSDQANHVLFYSDGVNVYDESGSTIPAILLGGSNSTQSALAVPIPSSTYPTPRFLIFTTVGVNEAKQRDIAVSLVTTSSAYPYSVSIPSPVSSYIYPYTSSTHFWSEKLACTSDGQRGYWILAHDYDSLSNTANTFYKFHLVYNDPAWLSISNSSDAANLLYTNVITQNIGMSHNNLPENAMGQMKFSLDGTKLGLVIGGSEKWEVFDFINGTLSPPITNTTNPSNDHGYYGCEFSPDGNYFYTTDGNSTNYLSTRQWNLNPPGSSTIIATDPYSHDNSLQLERECGQIYCARLNTSLISVIEYPNTLGSGCNYIDGSIPVSGGSKKGLPSYYILPTPIPPVPCECINSIGPISVPVKSNGEGTVDITLNSGDISPTYIRIDWANFEVTTNSEDCRKYCCGMTTENMGMLVPTLPTINNFTSVLTPWSTSGQTEFSREIVFTSSGGDPQPIRDLRIQLNLKFPFISDLSCCEAHYFGSFMVTYVDKECHMCQSLVFAESQSSGDSRVGIKNQSYAVKPVETVLKTQAATSPTFKVYPNPNEGTFTISTSNLGTNLPYEVMDEHGSLVSSGTLNGDKGKINISNFSAGIYYVRVISGTNKYTEKVVLQK